MFYFGAMTAPAISPAAAAPFSIGGAIPKRRLPFAYRLGLTLSAGAMLLLPLVYVGLIGAVIYGVWWFASRSIPWFRNADLALWIFGYGGVIVAGLVVVAFLIKPLFAPKANAMAPATLDLEQQPQLRALIAAIAEKVGAPMPVRVDVDCSVNASARLRLGLLSLGRRDLVLTIGLPFAGGLTARQLAGVLAHELGHFAQGAGMATTYVIRTINGWFARVVFDRDTWDETIALWSRRLDIRVSFLLWAVRGAVWISRKILHGLMVVAHAIACWQLRQMEYDADYYEVHLAGTEAFLETSKALAQLNLANAIAFEELGEFWRDHRLVDDFPGYVLHRRRHLEEEIARQLAGRTEKARWSDTHPLDAQRAAAAQALNLPGLFGNEAPANTLFFQFEELCREASSHYYRETLGLEFAADALLPTSEAVRPGYEAAESAKALRRIAGTALDLEAPVLWTAAEFAANPPTHLPDALAARLAAYRAELDQLRPAAETAAQHRLELRRSWIQTRIGREFFAAHIDIDPSAFELATTDLAAADARAGALVAELERTPEALATFERALHDWAVLVVSVSRFYRDSLPTELVARVESAARTLLEYRPWLRAFAGWAEEQRLFSAALVHDRQLAAQRNYTILGARCEKLRKLAENAPSLVEGIAWPLAPVHAPRTAKAQLERALEHEIPAQHLAVLLRQISEMYFNAVGKLALYGGQLQDVLANSEVG